jgi:hypothetical protein
MEGASQELQQRLDRWIVMWREIGIHAGDVALVATDVVVQSEDVSLYERLPEEIKAAVVADVELFRKEGRMLVATKDSLAPIDISERMQRFIDLLRNAGIELQTP